MKHVSLKPVLMKGNPATTEKWVQELIANDPQILGLGDLALRDKERQQPRAGRLDLLLQDTDSGKRYEVELQLGPTDESHIIRTIEYWDLERKRYPQYDHCAVIIAEQMTGRFLNVVSLFNGFIPLIALQMTAYQVNEGIALTFTKVLDEMPLGPVEEDEIQEPADRAYWERRGSRATLKLLDSLLGLVQNFAPSYEPKYNRHYVGLAQDGSPNNFAIFKPRKKSVLIEVKMPKSEEASVLLEESGLDSLEYSKWGRYRLYVTPGDLAGASESLEKLLSLAKESSGSD